MLIHHPSKFGKFLLKFGREIICQSWPLLTLFSQLMYCAFLQVAFLHEFFFSDQLSIGCLPLPAALFQRPGEGSRYIQRELILCTVLFGFEIWAIGISILLPRCCRVVINMQSLIQWNWIFWSIKSYVVYSVEPRSSTNFCFIWTRVPISFILNTGSLNRMF